MDSVKAWKNPEYRHGLADADLPENPAGVVDLNDEQLYAASGGQAGMMPGPAISIFCTNNTTVCGTCALWTHGCC